ncbi:hypothetical protein L7F22_041389 [Adiantum nelumboides]|nr:hypothetical protein [Adiantum nelumboides]
MFALYILVILAVWSLTPASGQQTQDDIEPVCRFAAAALISDIILVSKVAPPFEPLAAQGLPPPTVDGPLPQAMIRSALPRTLTRLTINRGLLHANMLVKHGCLRMLSEILSAGEFYLCSINKARSTFQQKSGNRESISDVLMTKNDDDFDACLSMEALTFDGNNPDDLEACEELDAHCNWLAFERHFESELRSVLPDPHVLFSLLSLKSSSSGDPSGIKGRKSSVEAGCNREALLDRERDDPCIDAHNLGEDLALFAEGGKGKLVDIWNADELITQSGELEDVGGFFNAKLLEVLATYQVLI